MSFGPPISSPTRLIIQNARLVPSTIDYVARGIGSTTADLWNVICRGGHVVQINAVSSDSKFQENGYSNGHRREGKPLDTFVSISFCHSHIHLDKCFLLSKSELQTGDFVEALEVTAAAKGGFKEEGKEALYERAHRVVRESVACGVTAMRAHVEVDTMAEFLSLEVAQELQSHFQGTCDIQIAVFAQEPLFEQESEQLNSNYNLLEKACQMHGVSAVGSAPYVENSATKAKSNISFVMELAKKNSLHVDFHLDYNLDPTSEPLIYEVVDRVRADERFTRRSTTDTSSPNPRVTIGHGTRLQLLTPIQWKELAERMSNLPISLVSLPQSDIYMMGRGDVNGNNPIGAPRGTLHIPKLAEYGLQVAMSVNNIENAFTPQGSIDPLSLCMFGAAIFQSATPKDVRTLLQSVTLTSKRAIGMNDNQCAADLFPVAGDPADLVILHGTPDIQRAVLNPGYDRTTIKAGVVVSTRFSETWTRQDQSCIHYREMGGCSNMPAS